MKIEYIGPYVEGVWIDLPNGRVLDFKPNEAQEVDDDIAESLLAQLANWRKADEENDAPVVPAPNNEEDTKWHSDQD